MIITLAAFWAIGFTALLIFGFVLDWQGTGVWMGLVAGSVFFGFIMLSRAVWFGRKFQFECIT